MGAHLHHGELFYYVCDGDWVGEVDGKPIVIDEQEFDRNFEPIP